MDLDDIYTSGIHLVNDFGTPVRAIVDQSVPCAANSNFSWKLTTVPRLLWSRISLRFWCVIRIIKFYMDFIGKSSAWIKPFVLYCLLSHSCKASTLVQPLLYGCCVYYIVAVFAKIIFMWYVFNKLECTILMMKTWYDHNEFHE